MCNPIVVFVNPEALRSNLRSEFTFPHTVCDELGNPCLILLDDNDDLPDGAPFDVHTQEPILIVAHYSSKKHRNPEGELEKWSAEATCLVCKTFSNVRGDDVYEEILRAIKTPEEASAFAGRCRQVNHLEALDGLAAICQLRRIDSGAAECDDVKLLRLTLLSRFDREFRSDFLIKYRTANTDEAWRDVLTLVEERAERIV